MTLQTNTLAKNVFLSIDGGQFFSDNYFYLSANEPKKITLKMDKDCSVENIQKQLKMITLIDTY